METNPKDATQKQKGKISESKSTKTFHSLIRKNDKDNISAKPEKSYLFPRGVCPPTKNLPESKSHLVNYQVEENSKVPTRKFYYIKDNVVMNDFERDYKPKTHYQKKRFTKTETDTSNIFSDETKLNTQKNSNLNRRIKENYTKNPVNLMSKNQVQDYNTAQQAKMLNHTRAVTDYLSSKNVQKSFLNSKTESNENNHKTSNINAVPASTLKNAIEQKKQEPNYSKRGFKSYLVGNKNQLAFV